MQVSFIIPCLNEAPRLAAAVRRAWEAGADEVIVADGGSGDGTTEIARGLDCRLVECPRPGRGIQQNAGAEVSQGDVLLFVHADNWLAPGATEQVRCRLARGATAAGAFLQRIEAEGRLYRWLERGNAMRAQRLALPYGDQGLFVRRDLFFAAGGFPDVRLMEDVILARKLRRRSRFALLPGPIHVSARRWQQHGALAQTLRNWTLLAAFELGVSPDRLADLYYERRPAG